MITESYTTAKAGTAQTEEELTQMGSDRDKVLSALKKQPGINDLSILRMRGYQIKIAETRFKTEAGFCPTPGTTSPPQQQCQGRNTLESSFAEEDMGILEDKLNTHQPHTFVLMKVTPHTRMQ